MPAGERPDIEAARKGGDAERRMAGEDPGAHGPEVARRWWSAYGELESLETALVDLLAERSAAMSEDARREASETNLPVLLAQLRRFQLRHAYWRERAVTVELSVDEEI
ncbi:MAG TPA: hypothetical protein VGJ79_08310 [Candidatus Dormibacteraeota bacterium]|jgi:hypothetical protein